MSLHLVYIPTSSISLCVRESTVNTRSAWPHVTGFFFYRRTKHDRFITEEACSTTASHDSSCAQNSDKEKHSVIKRRVLWLPVADTALLGRSLVPSSHDYIKYRRLEKMELRLYSLLHGAELFLKSQSVFS